MGHAANSACLPGSLHLAARAAPQRRTQAGESFPSTRDPQRCAACCILALVAGCPDLWRGERTAAVHRQVRGTALAASDTTVRQATLPHPSLRRSPYIAGMPGGLTAVESDLPRGPPRGSNARHWQPTERAPIPSSTGPDRNEPPSRRVKMPACILVSNSPLVEQAMDYHYVRLPDREARRNRAADPRPVVKRSVGEATGRFGQNHDL
jgi:hypothetical protein